MRLIDADALVADIIEDRQHQIFVSYVARDRYMAMSEYAHDWVADAPTIDAVPVVRCNMCKYYEADVGFCNYHGHGMHWDDFCSRGAKMDLEKGIDR